MNAYEIADELDGRLDHKAANMLRQQADRIAELEHMNKNWQLSETMAYNRIAELEKVSKPVAWMDYLEHSNVYDLNVSGRGIPLYTTPQIKKLSDEEIIEIRQNTKASSTNNWADSLAFARAILKKASEK